MASRHAADPAILAAFGGPGWLFFLCFFRIFFTNRFSSIFLRFLKGFGRQNGSWNRFFDHFFGCFFAPSFYLNFLLFFVVFFDARNLKNCAPVQAGAKFWTFRIFNVRLKSALKIGPKNQGFWNRKSRKILEKTFAKEMFFSTSKFHGFGPHFGSVSVGFWVGFGSLFSTFFQYFTTWQWFR